MLRSVALRPWPPIAAAEDAEDIASSLAIAGTDIAGTGGTPPNRCSPKIPLKYGPGAIASVNDSLLYNALNLGILRPNKPAA